MRKDFNKLTDYELSWLLLMIMLRGHSHTGVSHGRSPRNEILAAAMGIMRNPRISADDYDHVWPDLEREACGRIAKLPIPLPRMSKNIESRFLGNQPSPVLAYVLLGRLRQWYQDETVYQLLCSEMRTLHHALILIPMNYDFDGEMFRALKLESLIWEAKERFRKKTKRKYRHH